MSTELIKLDSIELTMIDKSKAEQIRAVFTPMVKMLEGFEAAYNEVLQDAEKEINGNVMANAKRVRLDIAKIRIAAEKVRKEQKEEYLRAGKAIDGVSNILKWATTDKENKLEEIEKHYENQEKARLAELQESRVNALLPYLPDAAERHLCDMEEDVWDAYFSAKKKEYDDLVEAKRQAEVDRFENERIEKLRWQRAESIRDYYQFFKEEKGFNLGTISEDEFKKIVIGLKKAKKEYDAEQEKVREENERLKIEAEKRAKEETERRAKEDAERKAREEKERAEKAAQAERERIAKEESEKKIKAERDERERLAHELAEKERQEKERAAAAEAAKQAELSKGDADKIQDLINDLNFLKSKYVFQSEKNIELYKYVGILLDKVIGHITK